HSLVESKLGVDRIGTRGTALLSHLIDSEFDWKVEHSLDEGRSDGDAVSLPLDQLQHTRRDVRRHVLPHRLLPSHQSQRVNLVNAIIAILEFSLD
ncbi:hypothetical protein PMAYCL1PPCAC_31518, partial [Pristionchus mayeri]